MKTYRPLEFRHVCAIARAVLVADLAMTDADWKAAVRDACSKQGWAEPDPEMLSRAMGAVERALKETTGLERGVPPPKRLTTQQRDNRCWTAADYKALAETLNAIAARNATVRPEDFNVTPIARQMLDVSEPALLDQFYAEAHAGDRIAVLRRFAEIAIARPADWDFQAVRDGFADVRLTARVCYGCCTSGTLRWHHIIQVQHGGSNYARNLVALCHACHCDVHPWLPKAERPTPRGWNALKDIVGPAFEAWDQELRKAKDSA